MIRLCVPIVPVCVCLVGFPACMESAGAAETPSTHSVASEGVLSPEGAVDRLQVEDDRPEGDDLASLEGVLRAAADAEPRNARWRFGVGLAAKRRAELETDVDARRGAAAAYLAAVRRAVELDPRNADYLFELGLATMYSISPGDGMMAMFSRAREARKHWEQAVRINPNHVRSLSSLGFYEVEARKNGGMLLGSYKEATRYGERLLKIQGGEFEGRLLLAQVALAQENWSAMDRHFAEAERLAAQSKSRLQRVLFSHAGALLNGRKDTKAALAVIERMIALSPDSFSAYYMRGSARKALGDCSGAAEDFRTVLDRNPAAMNSRFLLAECYESLGDARAACEHYEEFARRFPQDNRASAATKAAKRLRKAIGS